MKSFKDRLTELLIDRNLTTRRNLDKALEIQKKSGESLARILVAQGFVSQRDLMVVLSRELDIPPIDLSKYRIDRALVQLIPERVARQYLLIPVSRIGKVLTIAIADPMNIFAIDDIKALTHYAIEPIIATEDDIRETINTSYGQDSGDVSKVQEEEPPDIEVEDLSGKDEVDAGEAAVESQKAPIVKVVGLILNEALKKRASDIHIEPCERALKVRYRIDGTLREVLELPKKNQNAVIARLKIMSKLDITETRLPQDGRFKINFEGGAIDFRVSVLPVAFGGKIVLRILDRSSLSVGLDNLGFLPEPLTAFRTALASPYGMILVTGPTGSGKSTTLYSIINQLNTPERNIITLEDPVEYVLDGITQIQARPEIGLTFANGLKSVLRQSPDIVMVGEIRDFETADVAIKASLTGQLILSTLHTNDAAGAITRLIDMGTEPFLVASSLVMSSAQRLMRRICSNCREEADIPGSALEKAGLKAADAAVGKKAVFYRGKGCPRCGNTGYYGRLGILETLLLDDPIREMIIKKVSSEEIKSYAVKKLGMKTLRDNALENFTMGTTTLEEVLRVTTED